MYRGSLSGCNYSCFYCPFAKKEISPVNLHNDKSELDRFIKWAQEQENQLEIMFTPFGEALIHNYYQEGIIKLSHLPNVKKVVIQTNLSGKLSWIESVNNKTVALWCSFHPSQVSLSEFTGKCNSLDSSNIRHSVGCVGMKEDFTVISRLRSELNPSTYIWINAYKHEKDYYSSADVQFLNSIDPLFNTNNKVYQTKGKICGTGDKVFSVKGNGDITRCHFHSTCIGNIYNAGFESVLYSRLCENETCHCYIGYVHLEELELAKVYGDSILERIYDLSHHKANTP